MQDGAWVVMSEVHRSLRASFYGFLVFVILALIIVFRAVQSDIARPPIDPYWVLSNFAIGFACFFMIPFETFRYKYSLHQFHWIFVFVFFFLAPFVQYMNSALPWGASIRLSESDLLATNGIIITWCLTWIFMRFMFLYRRPKAPIVKKLQMSRRITWFGLSVVGLLTILMAYYALQSRGLSGLLFRGAPGTGAGVSSLSQPVQLITNTSGRAFSVAFFLGALFRLRQVGCRSLSTVAPVALSALLLLLTNFPFGTARYWAGAIWTGIAVVAFGHKWRSHSVLSIGFVVGLLVVFPLINAGRYVATFDDFSDRITISQSLSGNLLSGDFDAYAMLAHTEHFKKEYGITWGRQLLGVFGFWIPREMWTTKPVGSGTTVAETLNLPWPNVSSPLPAEGLINFGYPGVISFSAVWSFLLGRLDHAYWYPKRRRGSDLLAIVYPFLLGFFVFQLRGDLLSSTAYLVGFVVPFFLLVFMSRIVTERTKHFEGNVDKSLL